MAGRPSARDTEGEFIALSSVGQRPSVATGMSIPQQLPLGSPASQKQHVNSFSVEDMSVVGELLKWELVFYVLSIIIFIASVITKAVAEPRVRPYFMNDSTIWHDVKDEDIPFWITILSGFFVGVPVIFCLELTVDDRSSRTYQVLRALRLSMGYLATFLLIHALLEWTRWLVGQISPDYIMRCMGKRPDPAAMSPEPIWGDGLCSKDFRRRDLKDTRASFPSNQTGGATTFALFLSLHIMFHCLHARSHFRYQVMMLCSLLPNIGAITVGLSRIWANRRHTSDVIGGLVFPILFVPFFYVMLVGRAYRDYPSPKRSRSEGSGRSG